MSREVDVESMELDALALEYQGEYGSASGNLDVSDLLNNPNCWRAAGQRPETGLSARDSSGMGGGGGSSTSFLARSTTLQSFPLPLNPPPPSPSPHLNPLERSSLPTSVPLPTQTCFRIILELENASSGSALNLG